MSDRGVASLLFINFIKQTRVKEKGRENDSNEIQLKHDMKSIS